MHCCDGVEGGCVGGAALDLVKLRPHLERQVVGWHVRCT